MVWKMSQTILLINESTFNKWKTPEHKLCIANHNWTFSRSATAKLYPANYPITEISYNKTPSSVPLISSITQNSSYRLPFIEKKKTFVIKYYLNIFCLLLIGFYHFIQFYKLKRAKNRSASALPNATKSKAHKAATRKSAVCASVIRSAKLQILFCKYVCQKENFCHSG